MKRFRQQQGLNILIADDDENDRFLLSRAIARAGVSHHVQMLTSGMEVIAYLSGEAPYNDGDQYPFPDMLILDIKMPVVSGLDVLRWTREHEACASVPVIMFSSSALEADIKESFRLGASGYFSKPAQLGDLDNTVKVIFDYWYLSHVPASPISGRC